MILAVMMGVIACVAAGFGLVGILKFRWYSPEQQNQAPVLMALKVGLAVLISALGVVSLAGLALGLSESVFDAVVILGLILVAVILLLTDLRYTRSETFYPRIFSVNLHVLTATSMSSALYVVVDRWLLSKLDIEYGPVEQRWLSWWEYPVDQ